MPRLTAAAAVRSAWSWLSRREVQRVLPDRWGVQLWLGAVVRQGLAQSAALAPVVAVRTAVPQADVLNIDETGFLQSLTSREGTSGWSITSTKAQCSD
jgi:hypothetical protein